MCLRTLKKVILKRLNFLLLMKLQWKLLICIVGLVTILHTCVHKALKTLFTPTQHIFLVLIQTHME